MGDYASQIRVSVDGFLSDSQRQGRRLRELLDEDPGAFRDSVRSALLTIAPENEITPGLRYAVALLSSRGLLADVVLDIVRRRGDAAAPLACLAHKLDPGFARTLARTVLEAAQSGRGSSPDSDALLRTLEMLGDGLNVLPLIGKLRENEDPRVRSRMALLLGKSSRAQEWFSVLRNDPDVRVRANAIESLWGSDGPFAAACFESALEDPHPRVSANALVGLYLQGDATAVGGLETMARSENPRFRAAAAWATGRTGDARFLPLLRQLWRDKEQNAVVTRHALNSMARINRESNRQARKAVRLQRLSLQPGDDGKIEAVVVVRDGNSAALPRLRPTDWRMRVDGETVWRYQAQEVDAPARLSVCYLLPACEDETAGVMEGWTAMMLDTAAWRRPNDHCTVMFYVEEPHPQYLGRTGDILKLSPDTPACAAIPPVSAPQFLPDRARMLAALRSRPESATLAEGPAAPILALAELMEATRGDRHIVAVLDALRDSVWSEEQMPALVSALHAHGVRFHCVITGRTPAPAVLAFRRLAAESGGMCLDTEEVAGAGQAAGSIVAGLYRHHRLACSPPASFSELEIEVCSPTCQGSATLRADAERVARAA